MMNRHSSNQSRVVNLSSSQPDQSLLPFWLNSTSSSPHRISLLSSTPDTRRDQLDIRRDVDGKRGVEYLTMPSSSGLNGPDSDLSSGDPMEDDSCFIQEPDAAHFPKELLFSEGNKNRLQEFLQDNRVIILSDTVKRRCTVNKLGLHIASTGILFRDQFVKAAGIATSRKKDSEQASAFFLLRKLQRIVSADDSRKATPTGLYSSSDTKSSPPLDAFLQVQSISSSSSSSSSSSLASMTTMLGLAPTTSSLAMSSSEVMSDAPPIRPDSLLSSAIMTSTLSEAPITPLVHLRQSLLLGTRQNTSSVTNQFQTDNDAGTNGLSLAMSSLSTSTNRMLDGTLPLGSTTTPAPSHHPNDTSQFMISSTPSSSIQASHLGMATSLHGTATTSHVNIHQQGKASIDSSTTSSSSSFASTSPSPSSSLSPGFTPSDPRLPLNAIPGLDGSSLHSKLTLPSRDLDVILSKPLHHSSSPHLDVIPSKSLNHATGQVAALLSNLYSRYVSPDTLALTQGYNQAISLALSTLTYPGDYVFVHGCCNPTLLSLLNAHHLRSVSFTLAPSATSPPPDAHSVAQLRPGTHLTANDLEMCIDILKPRLIIAHSSCSGPQGEIPDMQVLQTIYKTGMRKRLHVLVDETTYSVSSRVVDVGGGHGNSSQGEKSLRGLDTAIGAVSDLEKKVKKWKKEPMPPKDWRRDVYQRAVAVSIGSFSHLLGPHAGVTWLESSNSLISHMTTHVLYPNYAPNPLTLALITRALCLKPCCVRTINERALKARAQAALGDVSSYGMTDLVSGSSATLPITSSLSSLNPFREVDHRETDQQLVCNETCYSRNPAEVEACVNEARQLRLPLFIHSQYQAHEAELLMQQQAILVATTYARRRTALFNTLRRIADYLYVPKSIGGPFIWIAIMPDKIQQHLQQTMGSIGSSLRPTGPLYGSNIVASMRREGLIAASADVCLADDLAIHIQSIQHHQKSERQQAKPLHSHTQDQQTNRTVPQTAATPTLSPIPSSQLYAFMVSVAQVPNAIIDDVGSTITNILNSHINMCKDTIPDAFVDTPPDNLTNEAEDDDMFEL